MIEGFRDDVADIMQALDVFVLPSIEPDPFPTVVLEAMWSGRPIVGFRHGGITEMIEDGVSGKLATPSDVNALADILSEFAHDPAARQRFGRAAQERVAREFSRDSFVRRFSALYQELTTQSVKG
jgi:glycosyltransferase involved in cell wall biosynthesis